jgi:FK506-binding nuclear protein
MSLLAGPVYGLEVPPGEVLIPASIDFPASFRITMAAVDPTEEPEADSEGNVPSVPRSTLRLVRRAYPGLDDEDEDDELDEDQLRALIEAAGDDSSDEDEDEANGGPSDPSKSKKQKQSAGLKKLLEAARAEEDDEDEDMEDAKPNGIKKGKGKAIEDDDDDEDDDDEDDDDDDSEDGADLENFVLCTLDTEKVRLPMQPSSDPPRC